MGDTGTGKQIEADGSYTESGSEQAASSPSSPSPLVPPALLIEGLIKQGQLEVKEPKKGITLGKQKWSLRWVIIVKGTMHLFKNYEKTEPYQSVNLQDVEVVEYSGGEPVREHAFGAKGGTTELRWFSTNSAQELVAWKEALLQGKSQEPSAAPVRSPIPRSKRTRGAFFKAKKRAVTVVGVPVMKKLFGENIRMLDTIRQIVAKHIDPATGKRVYNLLIKLIFKVNFQFEKKNITLESLTEVDKPLREALELLTKYYNSRVRRYVRKPAENESLTTRVEQLMCKARDEMCKLLEPYLTPKNIKNLRFLSDTLSNAKFLERVYNDPELSESLDEIDDLIASYTQFHF